MCSSRNTMSKSSTSIPSQNSSHHNKNNLDQARNEKHQEQDSVGFAGGLQTEIPNQEFGDQRIQQPVLHPLLQEVQPQREEVLRVGAEDVLIVSLERPLFTTGRPRLQWSEELNTRFCRAVDDLGGIFSATPTTTLRKMNVRGVTVDHIRSRLQKVRRSMDPNGIHIRRGIRNNADGHSPQPSGQGSSANACVNGQGSLTFEAGNEESGTSNMAETPNQDEDINSILMNLEDYSIDELMAWLVEED